MNGMRNYNIGLLRRYRWVMGFFIAALLLSGITAFPLLTELEALVGTRALIGDALHSAPTGLDHWLVVVRDGLRETYAKYPWVAYGTDWLAFAHIIIALFLLGPYRDPVRNVWVVQASVWACVLILPLAHICGPIRGIPMGWRWIDCSFGLLGLPPLLYCLNLTRRLEAESES